MPIPSVLVALDMIVMGPLPGNGYSKPWLAMDVCSASDIPAFRQHAILL
jgi:hypothetical protein